MKYTNNIKNIIPVLVLGLFLIPRIIFADEVTGSFTPLVGIPGIDPDADFTSYINALYALSISLAALLAVIKIIIAGVKWMLTDIVSGKQSAKEDIQGSLVGLLIIISAVVVLNFINPKLTSTNIILEEVEAPAGIGDGDPAYIPPQYEVQIITCSIVDTCTRECISKPGPGQLFSILPRVKGTTTTYISRCRVKVN